MSGKISFPRFAIFTSALLITLSISAGVQAHPSAESASIIVKGSDTMVHLVSAWAEAYVKKNPADDVAVTGGGSGAGIAALINGSTNICAASRSMKPEEFAQAREKNVAPQEIIVARDGISVAVNPANPLKEITMEQLEKIFTGDWTNWNQLGGPNLPIEVLSRESSSGTFVFFQEHVMKKRDYSPKAMLLPATAAIVETVGADKGAVGYVGLGYATQAGNKIKVLPVKADAASAAVMPSEATVKSGAYPVSRPLFFYTNGAPKGLVKRFIDFCLSPEGQQIVREQGYIASN